MCNRRWTSRLALFTFLLGMCVTEQQLEEVAEHSDVLAGNEDYLPSDIRARCQQVIADPLEIVISDFAFAFRYLKENVH